MNKYFSYLLIFIIGVVMYYFVYTILSDPSIFFFKIKKRVNKLIRMQDLSDFEQSGLSKNGYNNKSVFSFINASNVLKRTIMSSGLRLKPEEFLIFWFSITFFPSIIYSMIFGFSFNSIIIIIIGFIIPPIMINVSRKKRISNFNIQLNDALVIISNSLRAGFTFRHAVARVAEDLPNPISEELKRVIREVNYGAKIEDSLGNLAERMQSKELGMINSAVIIQQKSGGNLAEIIEKVSLTISERIQMKNQIKALTAQGRMSGIVIAAIPVFIGVALLFINPSYILIFFENPIGIAFFIFSIILEIIGFLIIQKLVDIKY